MRSVEDREPLTRLRSFVISGDGPGLVSALGHEPWPADCLQLIGDGLLAAVRNGVDGSVELARDCVRAVRERRWDGDEELAEALEAALGEGSIPMLRRLLVDLEELSMVVKSDPVHGGGRIDLRTGEVWPRAALEYAEETGEELDDDPGRWLWVASAGSRDGYQDMVMFIDVLDDSRLADRLARGDLRERRLPEVQGPAASKTRGDDALVRVLSGSPTRACPQLAGRRGSCTRPTRRLSDRRPTRCVTRAAVLTWT